jgi:hypothetical protein
MNTNHVWEKNVFYNFNSVMVKNINDTCEKRILKNKFQHVH